MRGSAAAGQAINLLSVGDGDNERNYGVSAEAPAAAAGASAASSPEGSLRRRKPFKMMTGGKIALALFGAVAVTGAIVTAVVLSTANWRDGEAQPLGKITLGDVVNKTYAARTFNGTWISAEEIQWEDAEGRLQLFNTKTRSTKPLVAASSSIPEDATFIGTAPANPNLALYAYNKESVWRHSYVANFVVVDSTTDEEIAVSPDGDDMTKIQYAAWVPASASIAYVYANDVYFRADATVKGSDQQVSDDGLDYEIYNGIPDWVYEEEVLATNYAMYFSPDGKRVAYAHFDDRQVETFTYQVFGDPYNPSEHRYPEDIPLKYPKAGTTNPTVELRVENLENLGANNVVLNPPEDLASVDHLYTSVKYISNDVISVVWMNRVQNLAVVMECVAETGDCIEKSRTTESSGWLDPSHRLFYNAAGTAFLQIRAVPVAGNLRYYHIVKVDNATKPISSGEMSVSSILGWDENKSIVYFMATGPGGDSKQSQFYSVGEQGDVEATCITCDLIMPESGRACLYNSISLNPDFTQYIQTCLGPDVPETVIRNLDSDVDSVFVLEGNSELRNRVGKMATSEIFYPQVDLPSNFTARVMMRVPPGLDPNAVSGYPMIVSVYAGPNDRNVDYRYVAGDWGDFLVTNYGIIYTEIDGRGSGFDSVEKLFAGYRNLGTVEIDDQIAVAKELAERFAFIDASRMGIWGWSYGGYATLMALGKDAEGVFSCGVSVAPVTTWYFYDTVYTERYMALPEAEDNLSGYEAGSPIPLVENFRDKMLLLEHGVADDNVHYQHSLMFMEAMQRADVWFQAHSFPDENHGIGGLSTFLYHSHERFWAECFGLESLVP